MIKALSPLFLISVFFACGRIVEPAERSGYNFLDSTNVANSGGLTGRPYSITISRCTPTNLSVRGVGGAEKATVEFAVSDSAGNEIIDGYNIRFILSSADSVAQLVNDRDSVRGGKVSCSVVSGRVSGAVSITAVYYERVGEPLVVSRAVPLLVCGGAPTSERFSIVLDKINIPKSSTEAVGVILYLADKYGNPSTGQMVHLAASVGLIGAGGFSDSLGSLKAVLLLYPPWCDSSNGTVVASTFNGDGLLITSSARFILSGKPTITAHFATGSDTFNLPIGGECVINYTVSDETGLPLCGGTKISIELSGGGILIGENDIVVPDVLSGHTDYSIVVRDDFSGSRTVHLLVVVSGRNGNTAKGLWGKVR